MGDSKISSIRLINFRQTLANISFSFTYLVCISKAQFHLIPPQAPSSLTLIHQVGFKSYGDLIYLKSTR